MEWTLSLAQAVPLPLDLQGLTALGPLGFFIAFLIWDRGRLDDAKNRMEERMGKMVEAHKIEIAAERALNDKLQTQRLEDLKLVLPLTDRVVGAIDLLKITGPKA